MANIMKMGKNPNYLGACDLFDLDAPELIVTIKGFHDEEVVSGGKSEICTVLSFAEDYKPMILNIENKKRLAKLFHSVMSENMVGKKIAITTEKVKAFGAIHDALRIKNQKITDAPLPKCEACGKAVHGAGKMTPEQTAAYTKAKYGRVLCGACATAAKESAKCAEIPCTKDAVAKEPENGDNNKEAVS